MQFSLMGRATAALSIVIGVTLVSLRMDWQTAKLFETTSVPLSTIPEHRPANPLLRLVPLTIVVRAAPHLSDPTKMEAIVQRFVDRGVNRVWLQVKQDETDEFLGGTTYFPNDIAPVAHGFEDDRFGRFVTLLTERGIDVFAWQPIFNDSTATRMHPEWRAQWIAPSGQLEPQPDFLCPGHSDVVEYQGRIATSVLQRYPQLKGLYLDFIRFDDDFSCGCDRCLRRLTDRLSRSKLVTALEIRDAGTRHSSLWKEWVRQRSDLITESIDAIRDSIDEVRPNCWLGASVLPFSMREYTVNTQSGQDFYEMARAGIDELAIMGYWDDWGHSPEWLRKGVHDAADLVRGECALTCLVDGDMGVRRTWRTIQELDQFQGRVGFFLYGEWSSRRFEVVHQAVAGYAREGTLPAPEFVDVVVRIDTEPDAQGRYFTVDEGMIRKLVGLFDSLNVKATFVTCGRLAELQPGAVRQAATHGHEIACHAYDHEQLDDLPDGGVAAIDLGLNVFRTAGLNVVGFAAPRNSLDDERGLNRVIEQGLEYDASTAYDPLNSLIDVTYRQHGTKSMQIVQIPFIIPNDWDARHLSKLTASQMLHAWKLRLDRVLMNGEPCFVLNVHQWLATQPDNFLALKNFLQYVKRSPRCRIVTLRDAAKHAREMLDRYELPLDWAGTDSVSDRRGGTP